MKNLNARIPALCMLFLVSGCSTLEYREPGTDAPHARARFTTDTKGITVVWEYADKNCGGAESEMMRLRDGYILGSSAKRLGMPLWTYGTNDAREVVVSAPQSKTFLFKATVEGGGLRQSCGVPVTVDFVPTKDYEIAFSWKAKQCSVTVAELLPKDGTHVKVTSATFDNTGSNVSTSCLDAFHKSRLY
jgi:hypothetical protein